MEYIIITVAFFIVMLVYFKIANKYNIIDKPNHRSAHTEITLRGGGIIFPIAFLFFLGYEVVVHNYNFSWTTFPELNFWIFGVGLLLLCLISFLDDMIDLSTKIRLFFHIAAVTLLLIFLNAFQLFDWWIIPVFYILIIGILNAYNFMDGINGMSGLYGLVLLGSILYVNQYIVMFVAADFIIYPMIASAVFLFFNFRSKARCFLGDIGSMAVGFWVIALLGLLIIETKQIKWILFLAIYGVDTILTIIERLKLKENIFEAHRRHLYQLFANEQKVSHLIVSTAYAVLQVAVNIFVILNSWSDWTNFALILVPLIIFYVLLKVRLKRAHKAVIIKTGSI